MRNSKHDFDALTAEIFRANVHNVDSEIGFIYGVDYPQALAMAIEKREYGRQLAAWMGLVPRQNSSGGKQTLLGISKRGDTYLRTLLIHGARSVIRFAEKKAEPEGWLRKLMARRNKNIAAVALANKNARIVWALLAKDRMFRPDYTPAIVVAGA